MSGETEANVSGWTVDTLHSHVAQRFSDYEAFFGQRIDDTDRMLARRMDDADKAIQAALTSAEKAKDKANDAIEKRFDGVNEFRRALSDQTSTFIPRAEYDTAHKALVDRVDSNAAQIAALELRLTTRLERGEGTEAGQAGQRTEQRLGTGQLLSIVLAVVAVATLILYITKK